MALVKRQSRSQRSIITILIVACVIAAGIYFFLTNANSQTVAKVDSATKALESNARDLKAIDSSIATDLDGLLKDQRFLELRQYGSLPVEIGKMGRQNPFQPF